MITHVITFKMKDRSPEHIAHCKGLLEGMVGKVESIRSLHVGVNVVDTPNSHDVILITTFDDLDGLDAYQKDPFHREVAAYLREAREASAVIDFEGTAG